MKVQVVRHEGASRHAVYLQQVDTQLAATRHVTDSMPGKTSIRICMRSMHALHVYAYPRDRFGYAMLGMSFLWPTCLLVAHLPWCGSLARPR